MTTPHVVVVGAGVAGLAAAAALLKGGADVSVLEATDRTGGKLRLGEIAGVPTDLGAESMLLLRPEGRSLARDVGLGDELVNPATTAASVWSRGALRALPAGHVMGIPTSVRTLAASGVVSRAGVARAAFDLVGSRAPSDDDVSVAAFVGARLGRAVVDRLVEPLLGGVYAGRADELSLRATLPQVAAVAGRGSLMRALRARPAPRARGPIFAGLPGGLARLTQAATAAIIRAGAKLRLDTVATQLIRTPTGWSVVVGSAAAPQRVDADAVVVAVPAATASRLLRDASPVAAADLAAIDYASMAIVTVAMPSSAFDNPLPGSGFLVPAVEGRLVKASTFSSSKWAWYGALAPDLAVVRCSVGRHGDVAELQRSDDELVAGALRELAATTGLRGLPRDALVTRWGGALPQYAVGHLDRVARIKAAVAAVPGLAVCGAAYDGVGIPACVASARAAAAQILAGTPDTHEVTSGRVAENHRAE